MINHHNHGHTYYYKDLIFNINQYFKLIMSMAISSYYYCKYYISHISHLQNISILSTDYSGVVKCPILGILDITKNSSHLVDH